jgi:Zn-dependent protease with chaperone function
MPPIPFSLPFAIALALAPAIIAWRTGRSVLARADDPVLPELLFERRKRLSTVTLVGTFGLGLLFTDDVLWALPLLWIALLVSAYPVRRELLGERLSALAFLRYNIFASIGSAGLWLLAGAAPALATSFALGVAPNDHTGAVRIAIAAGVVLAAIVGLWQYHYTRVFVSLHHATPLRESTRPVLMARLDAILERAAPSLAVRPQVYRYGAPGAYVMNAFAIPSWSRPAVALGDTLLATMSDDEIAAVFAHEIAHHEQFNAKRFRRARWRTLLIIPLIGVLPALLVGSIPGAAMVLAWCVPVLLAASFGKRSAERRDNETASDMRAVTLTGNLEAVVSALTKLHVYSRIPRRWPHAAERAATHPSLARRLQALRETSQAIARPEAQVATPLTAIRSPRSGVVVAFDRERAYWFEGVAAQTSLDLHSLRDAASSYRAISYADLTELRVGVAETDRSIDASDRDGRRWCVPVAPNDVPVIQAALDAVDVKLGRRRPAVSPAGATVVRWLAVGLFATLAGAGQLGFAALGILFVLVRPAMSAAVAATATIAIARVLIAARLITWTDTIHQIALLLALTVSIVLVVQTVRRVRVDIAKGNERRLTREGWMVAGALAVAATSIAISLFPIIADRPASFLSHPLAVGLATTLLGASAALLTIPNRWWRATGCVVGLASLGGGAVLRGGGSLLHRTPSVSWTTGRLTAVGGLRIPGGAFGITASPNGTAFALTQYAATRRSQGGSTMRYVIGRIDDSARALRTSTAAKIVFLDEETLIALDSAAGDSLEIRAERVVPRNGKTDVLWRQRLPAIDAPVVTLDRANRRWIVSGRGEGDYAFVVITDTVGGSLPRARTLGRRAGDDVGEVLTQPLTAFPDGGAIWSTMPGFGNGGKLFPLLYMFGSPRWELRGTDAAGERFLGDVEGFPSCGAELDARGTLCVERSPNGSHVWRAPSAKLLEEVADLPPTLDLVHAEGTDRVAAAERFGQRAVVLDASTRRAFRLTLPGGGDATARRWTADVVARGSSLLVLSSSREGAIVTRYSIR